MPIEPFDEEYFVRAVTAHDVNFQHVKLKISYLNIVFKVTKQFFTLLFSQFSAVFTFFLKSAELSRLKSRPYEGGVTLKKNY